MDKDLKLVKLKEYLSEQDKVSLENCIMEAYYFANDTIKPKNITNTYLIAKFVGERLLNETAKLQK